jgi:hypothetical protein
MSKAEKFISDCTRNCSNEIIVPTQDGNTYTKGYNHWLTPDEARKAVYIAMEEAVERACEYIDGLIEILNDHKYKLNKERIIGGLKQAMEDE